MNSHHVSASEVSQARRMLFVSDERGWPRTTGYRRRTSQSLRSVAELGPTVWVVAPRNDFDPGTEVELPSDLNGRVTVVQVSAPNRPRWQTAVRWLGSRLPWPLAAGDWTRVDGELQQLADRRFDLIWAMGIDSLRAVRRAGVSATTIFVDADLESLKLKRQLDLGSASLVRRFVMAVDRRRWTRLERDAAATTTGFSVCSDEERRMLGRRAFVTFNSYSMPDGHLPRFERRPGSGERLLFVGSLDYQPNVDGLRWFTTDVLPLVRRRLPSVRLRVVGSGGRHLDWLRATEGVDVLGMVDDVQPELESVGVAVVPLLWGAGTRVKILESWAHCLPVVSTTVGAEGLKARHDHELLIADDPSSFAEACFRLCRDDDLARRLSDAGYRRFLDEYEETAVRHRLTTRLKNLLESAGVESATNDR